jgi:hypothetical protein
MHDGFFQEPKGIGKIMADDDVIKFNVDGRRVNVKRNKLRL